MWGEERKRWKTKEGNRRRCRRGGSRGRRRHLGRRGEERRGRQEGRMGGDTRSAGCSLSCWGGLHSSGCCQISVFENKYIIGAGERRCQRRGGERIARDPLRRETPPALRRTGLSPFFAVFPARPADILDQRGGGEGARERARERETDRQTDRPRQRQRDRETKRQRDRERASPPHSPCRRG